jgi:hypothetical protein
MLSQNYRKLCWIRLRTPRYEKHKKLKFVDYVDWSMLSQNYGKLCWIRLRTPRYGKHKKVKL